MIRISKKIVFLMLFIIIVNCLCGCTKSEKDIANELKTIDSYFTDYQLDLTDYKISKRQTNDKDKTDFIWIDIDGENEDFSYSASYELTYVKYNDGWLLEDNKLVNSIYISKSKPDPTNDINIISQNYDTITLSSEEIKLEDNIATFHYDGILSTPLITDTYDIVLEYTYSPQTGWINSSKEEQLYNTKYDILGEWLYQDESHTYYVHIVEAENNQFTLKYAFLNDNFCQDDDFRLFNGSDYNTYDLILFEDDSSSVINEYSIDLGLSKTFINKVYRDEDYLWFIDNNDISGLFYHGYELKHISNNSISEKMPDKLLNAENEYINDYSSIPNGIFNDGLMIHINNFGKTYKEIGLLNHSGYAVRSILTDADYEFVGNHALAYADIPTDSSKIYYLLALEIYTASPDDLTVFEEIKSFFKNTIKTYIYEESNRSIIVSIPNTDLIADIYANYKEPVISIRIGRS